MDQTPNPIVAPQVQDKRVPPAGLLPKNMQALVLCSVAAVMVLVIAFSGRNAPKERSAAPGAPATVDPNTARIQDYQARIDEQARKLQLEQAQLARTQQNLGLAQAPGSSSGASVNQTPRSGFYGGAGYGRQAASESGFQGDGLPQEQEKREYHGLFASNVALSYRKVTGSVIPEEAPRAPAADAIAKALALYGSARPQAGSGSPQDASIRPPAPPDQTSSLATSSTGPEEPRGEGRTTSRAKEADSAFGQADGKRYRLFEGTVLETVLTNRLDGSFSGPVNCMVTTNVYSHSGQHLLIPQGTRVLGEVRRLASFGEQRLAVSFHRAVMPDGYTLSLDKFQGLNQIGETGLRDQVNHHYMQVFGVSVAIGAIAGLGQVNTRTGFDASAADTYQQGVAASLSQSSLRILDRYLNVLPTMTIREGHRVKVYLSDDLLLPAYDEHHIPIDF